ncbi:MAG: cytochrome b/b6 domain-containing protein [Pseudomonadaceae bacterium]|nr:cytochrome b/b6 domain-containing protein [Pseudomonadaceae bacterium]
MQYVKQDAGYSSLAQILHWLIAAMIVVQYVLAELAEGADDAGRVVAQLALLANHKSVGMTVLLLAIIRLAWRAGHPPPPLPAAMPLWQKRISGLTHALIYALLFSIPLSGWLMSSASAYSVSWFNLFAFPDLIAPSENLAEVFTEIHHLAAEGLFVLVVLHAAAALKHHFFDKDTVLKRMISIASLATFAAALVIAGATLIPGVAGNVPSEGITQDAGAQLTEAASESPPVDNASRLDTTDAASAWVIDYDKSQIAFTGDQAGAPFTGRFERWQAAIHFDLDDPDAASASVSVELASVNSQDSDRDDTARGSDWFDVDNTPSATFTTKNIEAIPSSGSDRQYRAHGALTIGQATADITLDFTTQQQADGVTLSGDTTLLRTSMFNLGRGDWADTDWVGDAIVVAVTVVATMPGD